VQPGQQAIRRNGALSALGVLVVYCLLRLFLFSHVAGFEDHDGVSYVRQIEAIGYWNHAELSREITPDFMPAFPLLASGFASLGASGEFAGRLTSFLASVALFGALLWLGWAWLPRGALVSGLLILSFLPLAIEYSAAVMTEMTYLAFLYIGLAVYFGRGGEFRVGHGALLGVVFGLAFLTRAEGVLFAIALPGIAAGEALLFEKRPGVSRRWAVWSSAFLVAFSLVAAPQIWRVSSELGRPALNGRQLWSSILNQPDGKSYYEKIYGLDYSDSKVNLHYLRAHPEVAKELSDGIEPVDFARTIRDNLRELWHLRIGELITPFGFALLVFGLLYLYGSRRYRELLICSAVLALTTVPSVLYNVHPRHLLPVLPLACLLMGLGAHGLGSWLERSSPIQRRFPVRLRYAVVAVWVLLCGLPLLRILSPARVDWAVHFDQHARIVREVALREGLGQPRITSRKGYLPLRSKAVPVVLPYADYDRFVQYLESNRVDFVFLERAQVEGHPFVSRFNGAEPPEGFEHLHHTRDPQGRTMDLYRFRPNGRPGPEQG